MMLASAACSADAERVAFAARDSAGIPIIEFDVDRAAVGWTVAEQPDWIVGDGSGYADALTLHGVVDARMIADEVAVAESSMQQVIRLNPATGTVRRFGGQGDGPNEFRSISRLYDLGDGRVAAYDSRRRRLVEIGADGTFESVLDVPSTTYAARARLERTRTGGMYAALVTNLPGSPVPGVHRGTAPLLRFNGGSVDTITTLRGSMVFSNDQAMGAVLFGPTTEVAAADSGVWVGDPALRELQLWRGPGAPATILRWTSDEPRAVTEARREELWTRAAEEVPPEQAHMIEQMRGQALFSDTIPAFSSLLVAESGELWVGSFVPPEQEMFQDPWPAQDWLVFDVAGGSVTRASTPAGLRLTQVGDDFVLGVHADDLGVQTVRRYRLSPTRNESL